ncbi:8266_t:CDS:10, partial [Ambispora leptoticha]
NGNVYKLTNGSWPPSFNYQGRFSNGIVWPDYLSNSLKIPLFDYSYASATSDATLVQVPGIAQQVQTFVSSKDVNADFSYSITTIWDNGNDYAYSNYTVDPKEVVSRLARTWETLYKSGIRKFLIPSLPNISEFPVNRDPPYTAISTRASPVDCIEHNNALDDAIGQFKNAHHDVKVYEFDVAQFFDFFKQNLAAMQNYCFLESINSYHLVTINPSTTMHFSILTLLLLFSILTSHSSGVPSDIAQKMSISEMAQQTQSSNTSKEVSIQPTNTIFSSSYIIESIHISTNSPQYKITSTISINSHTSSITTSSKTKSRKNHDNTGNQFPTMAPSPSPDFINSFGKSAIWGTGEGFTLGLIFGAVIGAVLVARRILTSTKDTLRVLNNHNHDNSKYNQTIAFNSHQHQREQCSVISDLSTSQTMTKSRAISRIYNDQFSRPALPTPLFSTRGVASLGKTQGTLVILGSGWAGFKLLKEINTADYNVVVISPRNYFVFTPLLPGTSVGTLEFRCITEPVRKFEPKVEFYQAYADTIGKTKAFCEFASITSNTSLYCLLQDLDNQIVNCTSNLEKKRDKFSIPYDTLVIAVGANSNTFGIPGVGEHALFLKDVSDARKIRQRVIECFEHASQPGVSEETKLGLLHFAVVGGGPTGVEFSAELRVLKVTADHLVIREEGEVPYGMIVWATGLTDNPLTRSLGDRIMKDNSAKRLLTDDKLRVLEKNTGKPITNVYAIGDCATIQNNDLPPTAQVANQKARYLRKALHDLASNPQHVPKPFKFRYLGVMAYIGKKEALVDLTQAVSPQAKESGVLAWFLWRSVYLSYTISIRNKLLIPMYWFLTLVFGRDISRF